MWLHETPNSLLFAINSHHCNFFGSQLKNFHFVLAKCLQMAQKSRPLQRENDIEFYMFQMETWKKWEFSKMRWKRTWWRRSTPRASYRRRHHVCTCMFVLIEWIHILIISYHHIWVWHSSICVSPIQSPSHPDPRRKCWHCRWGLKALITSWGSTTLIITQPLSWRTDFALDSCCHWVVSQDKPGNQDFDHYIILGASLVHA